MPYNNYTRLYYKQWFKKNENSNRDYIKGGMKGKSINEFKSVNQLYLTEINFINGFNKVQE